ncbi:MAG: DNA polymerase III subunit delta [Armatimonadota bacterium]
MQNTYGEFIKNKNFPFFNFYYLVGEDYFMHQQILKNLVDKYVGEDSADFNYHTFEAKKGIPVGELISLVLSYPAFSDHKLIHIKNIKLMDKSSLSSLIESFKQIPKGTIVVISVDTSTGKGELSSFIKKSGVTIKCVLSETEFVNYVKDKLKKNKVDIRSDAAHLLVSKVGHNLGFIDIETEKLISFAKPGGHIVREDIDKLIAKNTFSKIYYLSDLIARKNLRDAVLLIEELTKEEGKEFVYMVLGYLNKHFKTLLSIKTMLEKGVPANKVAEELGMRMDYYFKNCLKQAGSFSSPELVKFFEYFQKSDFNLKNSQNPLLTLELMLMGMCKK